MSPPTDRHDRPTLLIFTLGAAGDCARSRLLPVRLGRIETAFHHACLDTALAAGRAAGCRIAVASDACLDLPPEVLRIRQRGRSFGERFRHAVAIAERLADGPLLIVGTDVPDLEAAHLTTALERLRGGSTRVVVGPSIDGGFYLLATAAPVADLLASVSWCSHDTLRSLVAAVERAGREAEHLEPLADLDHRRDLERWIAAAHGRRGPLGALVAHLRRVLAALCQPLVPRIDRLPTLLLAAPLGGRAPPDAG